MPRTRVLLNSKARQLGWLKPKIKKKNTSRLLTNKLQQLKKISNKILKIAYYDNHLPNSLEKNFNKASGKFVKLNRSKFICGLKDAVNGINKT